MSAKKLNQTFNMNSFVYLLCLIIFIQSKSFCVPIQEQLEFIEFKDYVEIKRKATLNSEWQSFLLIKPNDRLYKKDNDTWALVNDNKLAEKYLNKYMQYLNESENPQLGDDANIRFDQSGTDIQVKRFSRNYLNWKLILTLRPDSLEYWNNDDPADSYWAPCISNERAQRYFNKYLKWKREHASTTMPTPLVTPTNPTRQPRRVTTIKSETKDKTQYTPLSEDTFICSQLNFTCTMQ